MSIQPGATYVLVNRKAHTALDLSGGDGRSIIGFDVHNGDNQKWRVEQAGGSWTLQNVGTGKFLGIEGNPENGTKLIGQDEPKGWDIWPDEREPSDHRLFIHDTPFNVDLSDHGNPTPGTPIQLWEKTPGQGQRWIFKPA